MSAIFGRAVPFLFMALVALFPRAAMAQASPPEDPGPTPALATTLLGHDASQDILAMLAATQQRTEQELGRLSFDCQNTSTEYVVELGQSVTVNITVVFRRQSGTRLLQWSVDKHLEHSEADDDGRSGKVLKVVDEPIVRILLETPEYFLVWQRVDKPEVTVYALEEWKAIGRNPVVEFGQMFNSADIVSNCLGLDEPFYELYRTGIGKWKVLEFEPLETIRLSRNTPRTDGTHGEDLFFTMYSQTGHLTQASYLAGRPTEREFAATYTVPDGLPRVPSTLRVVRQQSGASEPNVTEKKYRNFRDLSDAPPMSIDDMGLPQQAILIRVLPDLSVIRQVWNGQKLEKINWRNE